MAFFVNPPLASLSGALTPVEAMPQWMQRLTVLNPIRHFGIITRSVLMKGSSLTAVWPHMLALAAFAAVLLTLSVMRFRIRRFGGLSDQRTVNLGMPSESK
jgi:ABC-2 type transport system permease protein